MNSLKGTPMVIFLSIRLVKTYKLIDLKKTFLNVPAIVLRLRLALHITAALLWKEKMCFPENH